MKWAAYLSCAAAPRFFSQILPAADAFSFSSTKRRVRAVDATLNKYMAGAAIYLASRAGDYVVGETLVVDGWVTLQR